MIKSRMALQIATQSPHLHQKQVEKAVDAVLGEIVAAMRRRDRVELRGFGFYREISASSYGSQSENRYVSARAEKADACF